MEFAYLVELFDTLSPIKHKYRILGRYVKYLKRKDTEEQEKEVEKFRHFLTANPDISDRKFTDPKFKSKDVIYMDCVNTFLDEKELDTFWTKMQDTERIFFPNGRPQLDMTNSDDVKNLIGEDPILSEVMSQISQSGAFLNNENPGDLNTIIQNPKFQELASGIAGSLTSGQYTKDNLEKTFDTLSKLVGEDTDPELNKMMSFVHKSIKDIKAGRSADFGQLIEMLSSVGGISFNGLFDTGKK